MENSKRSFLWNEFWYTNLAKILIPNSVIKIAVGCFLHCCHLTSVSFEKYSNLIEINDCAFSMTKIKSIPKSVKRVGNCRFLNCHNLETIILIIELKLNEIYQKVDYNLSKIYLNWINWQRKYHFLYYTNRDHNNWKKCI